MITLWNGGANRGTKSPDSEVEGKNGCNIGSGKSAVAWQGKEGVTQCKGGGNMQEVAVEEQGTRFANDGTEAINMRNGVLISTEKTRRNVS